MGLFSGIAKVVKGAVSGFNPVGMLASAAVNALVGKYQTRQQNKAIDAANAIALERESTQFERLRDSAVRAGFNPLTALRSGMFQQANLFAREADTFRGDLFGGLAKAALAMPQARLDAEMRDLERREREMNIDYIDALTQQAKRPVLGSTAFDQESYVYDENGNMQINPVTGRPYRYAIEADEVIPMMRMYSLGGQVFESVNMEAFESGASEVAASSMMHSGFAGYSVLSGNVVNTTGAPLSYGMTFDSAGSSGRRDQRARTYHPAVNGAIEFE